MEIKSNPAPNPPEHGKQSRELKLSYKKRAFRFLVKLYHWATKKLGYDKTSAITLPHIVRSVESRAIGKGGTGSVFKVESQHKLSAYKLDQTENDYVQKSLEQEAHFLKKLNHPYIMSAGDDPQYKEVVMTLEEGLNSKFQRTNSLEETEYIKASILHEGKAGLQMALAECDLHKKIPTMDKTQRYCTALQMLSAVNYLHKNAICHVDIKPQNILWVDNKAMLADFDGAVEGVSPYNILLDQQAEVSFTKGYAPPELINLFKGRTHLIEGTACDVWSLGCTIAEILTGEQLFTSEYNGIKYDIRSLHDYPYEQRLEEFLEKHKEVLNPEHLILREMLQRDPKKRCNIAHALHHFEILVPWDVREAVNKKNNSEFI